MKSQINCICPINFFISNFRRDIDFGNCILHKLSEDEREKFFGVRVEKRDSEGHVTCMKSFGHGMTCDFFLPKLETCLLYGSEYLIFWDDHKFDSEKITNLILAFRLHKLGKIFAPLVFKYPSGSLHVTTYPLHTKFSLPYQIDWSELNNVKTIFHELNNLKKDDPLLLTLERFTNSLSTGLDNKISFVEYVSILESLFLKNSNTNELNFRFSLIISYILSNKLKIKTKHQVVSEWYKIRSELVHCGKSKKYNQEKFEFLDYCIRKLLVWYLENSNDYYKIEEEIFSKLGINENEPYFYNSWLERKAR